MGRVSLYADRSNAVDGAASTVADSVAPAVFSAVGTSSPDPPPPQAASERATTVSGRDFSMPPIMLSYVLLIGSPRVKQYWFRLCRASSFPRGRESKASALRRAARCNALDPLGLNRSMQHLDVVKDRNDSEE